MSSDPPGQYHDDRNLAARQRLWAENIPAFDLVEWVLDVAQVVAGVQVLDVGCGNGRYLDALQRRGSRGVGVDVSEGMVRGTGDGTVLVADASALPFETDAFDIVLVPHMLYHVADRPAAVREFRRVLHPGGTCVVVTNGGRHIASIRGVVERIVRETIRGWVMTDHATAGFSLENGAPQLAIGFDDVELVRPAHAGAIQVRDPKLVADYVASLRDLYDDRLAGSWNDVVNRVREDVGNVIARDGDFVTAGDVGCFVCR